MNGIVDTGALVALFNKRDDNHARAVELLAKLKRPWLTCEAVISETHFLLQRFGGDAGSLLQLLARGVLRVGYSLRGEEEAVAKLLEKYASTPMSLADACLVRMCETNKGTGLLTFDSDFDVYRLSNRRVVPRIS